MALMNNSIVPFEFLSIITENVARCVLAVETVILEHTTATTDIVQLL